MPSNKSRKEITLPLSKCLVCGYAFECASNPEGNSEYTPSLGSISVCMRCGAVAKYGLDMLVEPLTEEEVADMNADAELMAYLKKVVGAIHFVQRMRASRN